MSSRDRAFRLILPTGDVLVLLLFVVAGQREHELTYASNPLGGIALTTAELTAAWIAAGLWSGAFAREQRPSLRAFMRSSVNAWLLAAPLATLLRALVLGRADIPVSFLLVVLFLGGTMLLGWRMLYMIAWRRCQNLSLSPGIIRGQERG